MASKATRIPKVHPRWGSVPAFHPRYGRAAYEQWLGAKEREALDAANERRAARGLPPRGTPTARRRLPIDKLVMRVNRELVLRHRRRFERSGPRSAERAERDRALGSPVRQVFVHQETGRAYLFIRRLASAGAAAIFPRHKLGPGAVEDTEVEVNDLARKRRAIDLVALARRLKCVYPGEVVGGWGGWGRIKPFDGPRLQKPRKPRRRP